VTFTGEDRPIVLLTLDGQKVMLGRTPARIVLPSDEPRSVSPRESRSKGKKVAAPTLDARAERLFEELRAHRLEVSKSEGVPPYVVASDRTLREIATARPASMNALLEVHGIGQAKAERFGEGFLNVVWRSGG
jgi:ATP-dependent DNA helicase RecQ